MILYFQANKIHIIISNVFGTYYQYCMGLTEFYWQDPPGYYDSITLDNIYASKAERYPLCGRKETSFVYPLIKNPGTIKTLTISSIDAGNDEILAGNGNIEKINKIV